MPVATVFENLEDGLTIDEIVGMFVGLTREQVNAVLTSPARCSSCSIKVRPLRSAIPGPNTP